jgi:hypothetical protein
MTTQSEIRTEQRTPSRSLWSPRNPWFWFLSGVLPLVLGLFLLGSAIGPRHWFHAVPEPIEPPGKVDNPEIFGRLINPDEEKTLRLKRQRYEEQLADLARQKKALENMIARLGESEQTDSNRRQKVLLEDLLRSVQRRYQDVWDDKVDITLRLRENGE